MVWYLTYDVCWFQSVTALTSGVLSLPSLSPYQMSSAQPASPLLRARGGSHDSRGNGAGGGSGSGGHTTAGSGGSGSDRRRRPGAYTQASPRPMPSSSPSASPSSSPRAPPTTAHSTAVASDATATGNGAAERLAPLVLPPTQPSSASAHGAGAGSVHHPPRSMSNVPSAQLQQNPSPSPSPSASASASASQAQPQPQPQSQSQAGRDSTDPQQPAGSGAAPRDSGGFAFDLTGVWLDDPERSDPLEPFLKGLGLSWAVRWSTAAALAGSVFTFTPCTAGRLFLRHASSHSTSRRPPPSSTVWMCLTSLWIRRWAARCGGLALWCAVLPESGST